MCFIVIIRKNKYIINTCIRLYKFIKKKWVPVSPMCVWTYPIIYDESIVQLTQKNATESLIYGECHAAYTSKKNMTTSPNEQQFVKWSFVVRCNAKLYILYPLSPVSILTPSHTPMTLTPFIYMIHLYIAY
jgi:hypothetical protein